MSFSISKHAPLERSPGLPAPLWVIAAEVVAGAFLMFIIPIAFMVIFK